MNGRFLLDTNIVIAIFAGDPYVREHLTQPGEIFVPIVALGELYYGAGKSTRVDANIKRIDEFAANCAVLGCDIDTSRHYDQIKDSLRLKGRPIPENDIWIAAVAQQHGLTVVSRDAHFEEADNRQALATCERHMKLMNPTFVASNRRRALRLRAVVASGRSK